jgi:hypothetical protein
MWTGEHRRIYRQGVTIIRAIKEMRDGRRRADVPRDLGENFEPTFEARRVDE